MTSDEALMLEFQGGSRAAFEELFARYRKPLYGFFGRRLNNPERAEDLVQETFLAVIRAASRYEPRALVQTYLYGIWGKRHVVCFCWLPKFCNHWRQETYWVRCDKKHSLLHLGAPWRHKYISSHDIYRHRFQRVEGH